MLMTITAEYFLLKVVKYFKETKSHAYTMIIIIFNMCNNLVEPSQYQYIIYKLDDIEN